MTSIPPFSEHRGGEGAAVKIHCIHRTPRVPGLDSPSSLPRYESDFPTPVPVPVPGPSRTDTGTHYLTRKLSRVGWRVSGHPGDLVVGPRLRGLVSVALPPPLVARLPQRVVARLLPLPVELGAELPGRRGRLGRSRLFRCGFFFCLV